MGTFISRQRDSKNNCLYVECAVGGPKKAGVDILPFRYSSLSEGKNLVDPRDAISGAEKIYKAWTLDYHDEQKRLRIVNAGPAPLIYDFTLKGMAAAKSWADKTFAAMEKCGHCKTPMGNKDPYEHNDLPNAVFCTERCISAKYRGVFGIEMPTVLSGKNKKTSKK